MGFMYLRLEVADHEGIGPFRASLLEQIDELSSIAAAARALNVSYSEAFRTVKRLNAIFADKLIETKRGGFSAGGATLTPLGKEVLRRFRRAEKAAHRAVQEHAAALERIVRKLPSRAGSPGALYREYSRRSLTAE